MAVLDEIKKELGPPKKSDMVGGVSRGAVGRRRKKKPESVLDEVNREISDEPEPEDVLTQVKRETETDPESVRRLRTEGQRLSTEQQKIAFEAERARPLTDVALGAAGAFIQAVPQTIGQLAKGNIKLGYEGIVKPLAQSALSGLVLDPDAKKQAEDMRRIWGLSGASGAYRSLASGVAQDIEETANAAVRGGMLGTSVTDLAAEKLGIISPEKSFDNYLSREEMRRGEAEDIQENPDRAATLLARNPLAGTVLQGASMLSGNGLLTPEAKQAGLTAYQEQLLQDAKFKPDEDISMVGEVLSPVGLPARLVSPVTKALGGTMETAGGLAVRGVTKPTIRGVNPLEGVGIGIRKVGEGAEAAGAKVSEMVTGRPDTFLASPATVVSAFTKRPGQLIEGSGKFLRDIGRQIDEGGIRGRTGIIERLGRDPNSSAWVQDLFGAGSQKRLDNLARKNKKRIEAGKEELKPGRGGVLRAKTADYGLRMANSLSKSGVSGAALNGIIGAADIETAEEFGRATGVGFGIGSYMQARIPERVGAVLDPTLNLRSKIDRVIETDPLDRRLDEDADLKRFRATADPELVRRAETIASPDELIASQLKELDGLFQLKAESEYAEEDTTELDGRITSMVDGINRLREQAKNLSQADLDERRRMVELDIADNLDVLRSNHAVAGLNDVDVNLLRGDEMAGWLRDKWGQTLERAEAVVGQFDGAADLSDAENQTLMLAKETVNAFNAELLAMTGSSTTAPTRGVAFDPREKSAAHLVRANVTVPTIVINADVAMKDPRGFRHSMLHEGNHALRQFQEVREMQQPIYERLFGKKAGIPDEQGNRQQITPGIITDEFIDNILTPLYFGGAPAMNFDSVEARREYIREEVVSEVSGISEGGARTIREVLDSPGQAVVDRLLISRQNSILGRLRAALELAGVELDSLGNVKSVLFGQAVSNATMPEVLAMMRQFKRQQLEYTDTMVFASKEMRENVEIGLTELMTNRALQEAYKDDVNWQHEVILDVRDENGDSVVQIPLPEDSVMNAAVGEYRIVNGQLVDENGTVLPIDSSVNLTGLPDNSRASVENRIARNVDGSPKIIQQKEIEARARQRDQMIKDAIDNAPDDGSPTRLRDTGNGYYVGIPSPSQLSAIRELPNTLVTPYVKKNLLEFIKVMQRRDGTRILMEYQPALKKGKYRALSPKIRDVVPIGFRFTKAGNWLAVNVSVSRMFDKLDLWARNKPENLDLWGRSPARFMDDVLRVLDNHNKNLAGQTNLDIDPDIAMQKKNRVNDFFNMFTKDTEAANPSRTKLKARRGQESADRILMSARIDRINQMQISNAQKFPVDYGKMKINFLPGQPNGELRLDPSEDLEVENDLGLEVGPGARFLPGIRYTSLPDDPKKTMADFYMLNAMITTPPTGWSLGKFGGEDTMFAPSADPTGRYAGARAEKYQDALDEAKQTLVPTLHSKITKALHFAIAAELRHIEDQVEKSSIPQELIETPFFQEYLREYAIQKSGLPGLKKQRAPQRYKSDSESYRRSFVAMEAARQKTGTSLSDVALLAERMFREPRWSSSFGGPKWGDIAQHLALMADPTYSTERVRAVVTDESGRMQMIETNEFRDPGAYSQMFQEIDRAYDLQHNTNTVFNKLKKYYLGAEGYGWIAKMLDFKANVGNPRELRGLVSGTMGRLADAWFADMRADAPLTQDLEESVKAQLPENFTTEAMEPQEFIDRLAKLAGTFYRKEPSGVRRDDPFKKIGEDAKQIHRNLKGYGGDWDAIEKDQNAHIGLILQDHFGDLGIAQTDAAKLFRMLLNEGKDPRVTGKTPTATLPTAGNASIVDPKKSGKATPGTVISPGDLLSPEKIKESAKNILANWNSNKVGLSSVDILGHRFYLAPTGTSNAGFADLTVRKKYTSGATSIMSPDAFGPPQIIKTVLMSKSSAKQIADAIQEFQDNLTTFTPAQDTPSSQYFIGQTFVPNKNKSVPTNLFEFAKEALGVKGINGVKIGDITLVSAGANKANDVTFKVYQGDSVAEKDLLSTIIVPSPVADLDKNLADWLAEYAEIRAAQTGYTSVMGWMAQDLSGAVKTPMPKQSEGISNLLENLPWAARNRVNQLLENLQDQEWVDANLANLPPSDIDASSEFVESLLLGNSEGLTKAKIVDALNPNDVGALGKYLYDVGKWAADKLEARKAGDMDADVEEAGLTPDSPAVGYSKADDTLMTIAEAAAMVGPFEMGSGENHVYFTTGDGTAITNPYEDEQSDSIETPPITELKKGHIMTYWANQGVGPAVSEAALAIFDAANPGHLYSKESQIMPADESVAMAKNEVAAQKQAMEFLNDMLLDEPTTIDGNTWELEGVWDGDEVTAAVVKLNGVAVSNQIPFEPETATPTLGPKGIYDDYFALDWMKDWKAPEAESLLTPSQDQMMLAASELVAALAGGYISKPEVMVGKKNFSAEINSQGNMVVSGYDENGNLTGAMPIQGSKTMDPVDLEAAVYEALDLLNAGVSEGTFSAEAPAAKKITTQAINEAAEALMNDETTSLGKYTFEPIASGLGGTRVNIYVEPGMDDPVSYFMLDPGEYREPSDMLDAFYDKISEFLDNNPEFDDGTGGTGPGARFMPAGKFDTASSILEDVARSRGLVAKRVKPSFGKFTSKYAPGRDMNQGRWASPRDGYMLYRYGVISRNGETDPDNGAFEWWIPVPFERNGDLPSVETQKKYAPTRDQINQKIAELNSKDYQDFEIFDERDGTLYAVVPPYGFGYDQGKKTSLRDVKKELEKVADDLAFDDETSRQEKPTRSGSTLPTEDRWKNYLQNQDRDARKNLEEHGSVLITKDGKIVPVALGAMPLPLQLQSIFEEADVLREFLPDSVLAASEEFDVAERDVGSDLLEKNDNALNEAWKKMKSLGLVLAQVNREDLSMYVGSNKNTLEDLSPAARQAVKRLAMAHGVPDNAIVSDKSFYAAEKWVDDSGNLPNFLEGDSGAGPARFMPGGGITPKTLYNFYHLATLESQGRIKSEYGQGLMREYLNIYKQRYLETLAPLVSDQIKKYIGRGRVDEPVTEESLNAAANDPVALDELMRQTYRSDMRRRNDVWNNITEHLKGLEAARTPRDIIFRIDRLNNAIHNTNELLFSKFKNAGELMDAFEAINDARDERAYARNVDRDLRQIEEFEGGPGARFMPAASKAAIVDRIVEGVKPEDRLKGESAWFTPRGWVNVSDHLDIFPEDLAELRKVNYDDLKDRNFVRVRKMGKTLWYEGRPTRKMLKELKDTAVERRLKLEEDPVESYRNSARFMPAWSADQLAERPEITAVPNEFDKQTLRPRFVYRLESIEDDPKEHELTDTGGFTFFTTSPESAAALALNFAYDGYRPTSENFSVYRYRLPENADIQRDHTLFNLDKMTSGQERVAAVKNAHEAMKLPLDAYRYVPAGEVAGTSGKRIDWPENSDLMKIYRAIRRGGTAGGVQFMPGEQPVNRKAWMTPDGEIINVEPGSEHRFTARQFFPNAESDEKAQMAAEDEGYLRIVREGDRLTVGSMRTPNRFQLRELKNLAEENNYAIENDRGRSILGVQMMPGNTSGSSQVDPGLAGVTAPSADRGPLSGAQFMPREVSGEMAWRGTYFNDERYHGGEYGGGNYEEWRENPFLKAFQKLGTTQVTYLAKDKELAYDFAQKTKEESYYGEPRLKKLRAEKFKIRGKSTRLFDPMDAEDREKVAKVLKKKRIPEDFAKRALKETTVVHRYDGNWKPIEMLAPAIKEAGFDGYIALENPEEETYGLFGDVAGMKDSMATPIRANSSGKNIQFMPGYNPRYTDDDGNFDRDAWLNDRRRAEAILRQRGVYKSNLSEEEYEQAIRALLREMR